MGARHRQRLVVASAFAAVAVCVGLAACGLDIEGTARREDAGVDAGEDRSEEVRTDAPVAAGPCSDPSLLLCLRFEGSFVDEARGGRLEVEGGVTFEPGVEGTAAVFEESASADVAGAETWSYDAISVEAWVKPLALPTGGQRVGLFDKDGSIGIFVYANGEVGCSPASARAAVLSTDGVWVHVACVWDKTVTRLYANGVERFSADAGFIPPGDAGTRAVVGGNAPSGDRFHGGLDTFRVFGRVRSAAEVARAADASAP